MAWSFAFRGVLPLPSGPSLSIPRWDSLGDVVDDTGRAWFFNDTGRAVVLQSDPT